MTLPPPIASGRTAEIYPWPDGRVLKLIRPGFPPFLADQEELGARIAYQATGCAPKPGEVLEVEGRRGVLLERIEGPNMLQALGRQPYRVVEFGRMLGRLHARLNATRAPELPSQRKRMIWNLENSATLPADLKAPLLGLLERLADGDRLCHGDFHIYNVILSPRGPVVVDWEPAMCGSPVGDVADTCLKTRVFPALVPGVRGVLFRLMGKLFEREYLAAYRQAAGAELDGLEDWVAIRAAQQFFADNRADWPRWEQVVRSRVVSKVH